MKKLLLALCSVTILNFVGCASAPQNLYSWGEYPQQSYLTLTLPEKASPQTQVLKLEKDIEKAKAKNRAVPPGLYAHLGLLHLNLNNPQRAAEYFELERQVYPESTVLMDRLLQKITGRTTGVKK